MLCAAAPGLGWRQDVSERGAALHWTRGELRFSVSAEAPQGVARWRGPIASAVEAWQAPVCTRLRFVEAPPGADADVRITIRSTAWPFADDDGGSAQVESDPQTGEIARVDVALNDLRPEAAERDYCEHVVAHELGHALGLTHGIERTSLMYAGMDGRHRGAPLPAGEVAAICALLPMGPWPIVADAGHDATQRPTRRASGSRRLAALLVSICGVCVAVVIVRRSRRWT